MHDFTPLSSLAGGALIGLAASLLLVASGRIAGISGIVAGLVIGRPGDRTWRAAFVLGLLAAGVAFAMAEPNAIQPSPRSLASIGVAGLLVLGFLDVGGGWDASLGFVMLGAIAVHFLAYRLSRARSAPLCADEFRVPTRRDIDAKLLAGAALFGVGWGLGGYCPGPGVVSLAAGSKGALLFVAMMLLGMLMTARLEASAAKNAARSAGQEVKAG